MRGNRWAGLVVLVGGLRRLSLILAVALLLAACAPWQPAPESRSGQSPEASSVPPRSVQSPPDWYEVKHGDTLYSIAFRFGLDWRQVAGWNDIRSPFTIRPGQELRMSRPPERSRPVAVSATADGASAPAGNAGQQPTPSPEPGPATTPAPAPEPAVSSPSPPSGSGPARTVGGVAWQWPTEGRLARSFDAAATRRGIGIAGTRGQDVLAAAAGDVVYSGTALIGYGELIIIKHSDKLLSAYGHNRRRLVADGDRVQRGQKIAEMGLDDRQDEMLHFEIRRDGQPVNPLDYLPQR